MPGEMFSEFDVTMATNLGERGALRSWCALNFSTGIITLTHCVLQPHLETYLDSKFRADDLTKIDTC